ncbi:MAG: OmpA family protein [Burkholderiaceae bacterium]
MRILPPKLLVAALGLMAMVGCSSVSLDEPAPILGSTESGQATASGKPAPGSSATAVPGGQRSEQGIDPSRQAGLQPGSGPGQAADTLLTGPDGVSYGSIYFAFDSAEVGRDYQPLLQKVAELLMTYPNQSLVIEGNTDDRGTSEYNIALGQRRAEAVVNALRILGAPDSRIEPVSNGEEKPRDRSTTEAARAENRRADLFFRN